MPTLTLDYTGDPIPEDWTPAQQRFARCIRLVPAPWWTAYCDVAEVTGSAPLAVAMSLLATTRPRDNMDYPQLNRWVIDFIRLRNEDGRLYSPREEHGSTVAQQRYERENELYELMGGRVIDGRADQGLRFPVAELARLWNQAIAA
jgi:hypothetical protein